VCGAARDEGGVALGRATVVLAAEHPRRLGERRQHEAVPGGQHLLVARRPHAPLARLEEARASGAQPARDVACVEAVLGRELLRRLHEREDRPSFEVAAPGHAVGRQQQIGVAQGRVRLDVGFALDRRRVIGRVVAERRSQLFGVHTKKAPSLPSESASWEA